MIVMEGLRYLNFCKRVIVGYKCQSYSWMVLRCTIFNTNLSSSVYFLSLTSCFSSTLSLSLWLEFFSFLLLGTVVYNSATDVVSCISRLWALLVEVVFSNFMDCYYKLYYYFNKINYTVIKIRITTWFWISLLLSYR